MLCDAGRQGVGERWEKERSDHQNSQQISFVLYNMIEILFFFLFFDMRFAKCLLSDGTSSYNIFYHCSFGMNAGCCKIILIWLLSFQLNGAT